MNFTVERERFATMLARVAKACGGVKDAVWSKHMLLTAEDGRIVGTGTDETAYLQASVLAESVGKDGGVVVLANAIAKLVAAMNDPLVKVFVSEDGKVTVADSQCKHVLPCFGADSFPGMPQVPRDQPHAYFEMDPAEFKRAVGIGGSSASTDMASEPAYIGVVLQVIEEERKVLFQSTSAGKRTSRYTVVLAEEDGCKVVPHETQDVRVANVPAKRIRDFVGMCGDDPVLATINAHQLQLECGDVCYVCRQIAGQVAPFDRLIGFGDKIERRYVCAKDTLQDALKRLMLLVEDEFLKVAVKPLENDLLMLASTGSDARNARERVPCEEFVDGEPWGLDCRFFLEAVQSLDCARVNVALSEPVEFKRGGVVTGKKAAVVISSEDVPGAVHVLCQMDLEGMRI